ncbi:TetR/AcrR family transcriptional regulator [Micromonospora chaiyaphumensis]|uniref:Transcriptional regulator, TetR family n=1 Tax=Micromonospora chaiyaphumensis TaxID=307119 RepID=A0A1C4VN49_9ACTN|nr:TetR/AcrR family transcriptional regulator [Micromonospora chaiyaphumensis]SCE85444.1 transcriptional regulator, TetR family [Micromonospora chaiyaphumensis]
MSIQARRERERAERERAIIAAARELAEAEGWDAVTTRRLAAEIEYSQPVLYSHFKGKGAIMAAVAVEGCADLADELAAARAAATGPRQAVAGIATAYAEFAERRPALYDAIFNLPTDLSFATQETPVELVRAFAELAQTLHPFAGDDNLETFTETFWSGLHGLVTLMRNGRLRREEHERRLAILVDRFTRLG